MIIGIGTDIVNISRIEGVFNKYKDKFLQKNFHPNEIDFFNNHVVDHKKYAFLAKRFAAKEAISKALGSGIGKVAFKDIVVLNNDLGAPTVRIDNESYDISNYKINISLSDDYPFAVAFVVISV